MNDLSGYITRMSKSMAYKKFWFDKVDPSKFDMIIDFGCGNGELGLAVLEDERFKDKEVVFYEPYKEMNERLRKRLWLYGQGHQDRVTVISDFELIKGLVQQRRTLIVFSSVLHECYSFDTLPFEWKELNCQYIVIRDMSGEDNAIHFSRQDKWKIFKSSRKKDFFDFVRRYGFSDKAVLHFLLKHLYQANWQSEVKENYFAVPWRAIQIELMVSGYTVVYNKMYNIPFLVNYSKEQFGVEYDCYTHNEVIFERF